jgi:hypothetical protein
MPTRPHRRREPDLRPVPPPPALNPSQTYRADPAGPDGLTDAAVTDRPR